MKRLVTAKDIAAGSITGQPADEFGSPVGKARETRITMSFRQKNKTYSMPHGLGAVPSSVVFGPIGGGYDPSTHLFVNAPLQPYFPGPRDQCVTEDFIALRCPSDWTWAEVILRR